MPAAITLLASSSVTALWDLSMCIVHGTINTTWIDGVSFPHLNREEKNLLGTDLCKANSEAEIGICSGCLSYSLGKMCLAFSFVNSLAP